MRNRPLIPLVMSDPSQPKYHARYQRERRARARAAGLAQLNSTVPDDLIALLDAMKQARGLTNRNEALAAVLREYFGRGFDERKSAVSP